MTVDATDEIFGDSLPTAPEPAPAEPAVFGEPPPSPKKAPDFVYFIPKDLFILKLGGRWAIEDPVTKEGLKHHLRNHGFDDATIAEVLRRKVYRSVYGFTRKPNAPDLFEEEPGSGCLWLNTWAPPEIYPAESFTGPEQWPTISAVLEHLTGGDQTGRAWLENWIAAKIQDPELLPKTAVVFSTSPGAGKGTLAFVIRSLLGQKNTASVHHERLSNQFNAEWADRLFVLADEVVSAENLRDISQQLKVYIDAGEILYHGKHTNARMIRNRLAWIFASNDPVTPVSIEIGDRRYSVFNQHAVLSPEYKKSLVVAFESDRVTPTPAFKKEIEHYAAYLMAYPVDRYAVGTPHDNESRRSLVAANLPGHSQFFEYVEENGFDALLNDDLYTSDLLLLKTKNEWDFGEEGISSQVVYQCYVNYCKSVGTKPLRNNKFGSAIANHRPTWLVSHRPYVATAKRQVRIYRVPRKSPAAAAVAQAPASTPAPTQVTPNAVV